MKGEEIIKSAEERLKRVKNPYLALAEICKIQIENLKTLPPTEGNSEQITWREELLENYMEAYRNETTNDSGESDIKENL